MKKMLLILSAIMTFGSSSIFAYDYYGSHNRGRHNERYNNGEYNRECRGNYNNSGYHRNYRNGSYGNRYHNNQNLSQEQIAKIQELETKYFPQIDSLKNEIYKQNQIINLEMNKENPDQNAINSAIDKKSKASSDLQKLRMEFRIERNKIYSSK